MRSQLMRKTVKNRGPEGGWKAVGVFKSPKPSQRRPLCSCEFRTETGREFIAFLKLQNEECESL